MAQCIKFDHYLYKNAYTGLHLIDIDKLFEEICKTLILFDSNCEENLCYTSEKYIF